MALIVNGTTVKKLVYNGTTCKKGIYNGTTVFNAETVLYENGVTNTGLVGGWETAAYLTSGGQTSVGFGSSSIHFYYSNNKNANSNYWSTAMAWSKNYVNLAPYKKINMNVTGFANDGDAGCKPQAWLLLSDYVNAWPSYTDNPELIFNTAKANILSNGTITIDVTNLNSCYFIGLLGKPNGSWWTYGWHDVTKVWLED